VKINGQLTLTFVVDSGAADVSIPVDVVATLLRTETITDADFLDKRTYQLADGSTVPSRRFMIRTLKIGDKTLEDVVGGIVPVAGSLLLGQSFLSRFKSWSIDNQGRTLILNWGIAAKAFRREEVAPYEAIKSTLPKGSETWDAQPDDRGGFRSRSPASSLIALARCADPTRAIPTSFFGWRAPSKKSWAPQQFPMLDKGDLLRTRQVIK
jgi:hypothetical protein